ARVWETATGRPRGEPMTHQDWIIAAAFSPDGQVVATGSDDTNARLWDAATGKPISPPLPHPEAVSAVAFSPDGRTLATGCEDSTARFWDTRTAWPLGPPLRHPKWFMAAASTADAHSLWTASHDGSVRRSALPPAADGTPEQIAVWTQVVTGLEMDANGAVQVLGAAAWSQRRERLGALGGV